MPRSAQELHSIADKASELADEVSAAVGTLTGVIAEWRKSEEPTAPTWYDDLGTGLIASVSRRYTLPGEPSVVRDGTIAARDPLPLLSTARLLLPYLNQPDLAAPTREAVKVALGHVADRLRVVVPESNDAFGRSLRMWNPSKKRSAPLDALVIALRNYSAPPPVPPMNPAHRPSAVKREAAPAPR